MRRTCLAAASIGAVVLLGAHAAGPNAMHAAKSTKHSLEITFDDSAGDRVASDGLGPYRDGEDGVGASLDGGTGAVFFETTPWSSQSSVRWLHIDFAGLDTGSAGLGLERAEIYSYLKAQSLNDADLRALRSGDVAVRTFYAQWPRDAQSSGYRIDWYPANGGYIAVECTDPVAVGPYDRALQST